MKEAIASNNIDRINTEIEDLQKTMYEVSAKLYQQAAPNGAAGGGNPNAQQSGQTGAGNGSGPNVYDADFKDVDNN